MKYLEFKENQIDNYRLMRFELFSKQRLEHLGLDKIAKSLIYFLTNEHLRS